jgi:hypothetical protein
MTDTNVQLFIVVTKNAMKNLSFVFLLLSRSLFAQNVFFGDREDYDHKYKSVINTDQYAKWVLDGEKEWYLAPDSIDAHIMTVKQWSVNRQQLKSSGFNEINQNYYWNPNTKTVVIVYKSKNVPDSLCVYFEYGTDIK